MEPVLRPEQMAAADEAAIAAGVPGAELMDRAAHACAVAALRMLGGAYGSRVVVVCGKGNNGGDGIACGRHLAAAGAKTTILLLDEPSADAAVHLDLAIASASLRIEPWSEEAFDHEARRADLVIDAVFGTGFSGAPRGSAKDAITAVDGARPPVLAVDIPSGVSGSDGSVPGAAVHADVTLAIQALKVGHVVLPGATHVGRCDVVDIGIDVDQAASLLPEAVDVAAVLPDRAPDAHKYSVGAVGLVAGSAGMTGAAVLAARGALRAGAGLVLAGVPSSCLTAFESSVIEAVKVALPEVEGQLTSKSVDEFAGRLGAARAVAVGPGLGRSDNTVAAVRRSLDIELPMVIDADGLWALAEILSSEPDVLRTSRPRVLTPHDGEFERLTGSPPSVGAVADAASALGCVIHLKGPRAITAAPDGRRWFNPTGNPGAATAGTGDVLTGVVAALCAQGVEAADATWAGAFLHGLAADLAARRIGRSAIVAGDLADAVPRAVGATLLAAPVAGRMRTVLEAL